MKSPFAAWLLLLCATIILVTAPVSDAAAAFNFDRDFSVSWPTNNVKLLDGGQTLQLILDEKSGGAGFVSKKSYLFGSIDMQIKLVPGDSAGTVTAYYLSSDPESADHDEIDFEFLGNVSGEPYILQTNIYVNGVGNREQRIYLWFDPTTHFHTYTVQWTKTHIVQLVDGVPIRIYRAGNDNRLHPDFPNKKPMRVYSSIWNGDSWATQGGQVKINWSHGPFVASYRGFRSQACAADPNNARSIVNCQRLQAADPGNNVYDAGGAAHNDGSSRAKLDWVRLHYMIYDYCTDERRNPVAPPECRLG